MFQIATNAILLHKPQRGAYSLGRSRQCPLRPVPKSGSMSAFGLQTSFIDLKNHNNCLRNGNISVNLQPKTHKKNKI